MTAEEEIRRVVPFIATVRAAYPDLAISVDTWRPEVGRTACEAGADLLNDMWGGWDAELTEVAAEFGAGLVCSHAGCRRGPGRSGWRTRTSWPTCSTACWDWRTGQSVLE